MKNIILGCLIVVLLVPAVSAAYTPISANTIDTSKEMTRESLEERKIVLMKQVITLLQMHVKQLTAQIEGITPQPIVLGISTSNKKNEVKNEKPRRRGGNSSSKQRASNNAITNPVSASSTVSAVPTCSITSDDSVYLDDDSITLTWKSTNAVRAYFETDFGGKDNLTPPGNGADVATSGTAVILSDVLGNPTVKLIIVSANNEKYNCTVQFTIEDEASTVENNVPTNEEQQAMILSLIDLVEELGGDTSSAPTEAEIAEMGTDELKQIISELLKQIVDLKMSVINNQNVIICPYTWTRDLSLDSTGADVLKLQQFLNVDPDTQIAATGEGARGSETDVYTKLTADAVAKFQVKYRSDVLSIRDLVNPTEEFDSVTRAKANSLCVGAPDA